jgi:hypothetical protein
MQSFPIDYNDGKLWFNFKILTSREDTFMLHVKFTQDAIWCNGGIELNINNEDFPFLLMSPIRRRAIQKQVQERNQYQPLFIGEGENDEID